MDRLIDWTIYSALHICGVPIAKVQTRKNKTSSELCSTQFVHSFKNYAACRALQCIFAHSDLASANIQTQFRQRCGGKYQTIDAIGRLERFSVSETLSVTVKLFQWHWLYRTYVFMVLQSISREYLCGWSTKWATFI